MRGFFNRILRINVTNQDYEVEPINDSLLERHLGGKGLATYLLLKENPAGVDPLAPENILILAIGPVAGTPIWGSCRYGIFTKSPQTGFYSESYSGGTAAEYMAKTGYDAIMIQ
ncbi:MAG: aldehyde:ferredoxin oxidoreductase, partial [Deltaproteobacteria bacterium]